MGSTTKMSLAGTFPWMAPEVSFVIHLNSSDFIVVAEKKYESRLITIFQQGYKANTFLPNST